MANVVEAMVRGLEKYDTFTRVLRALVSLYPRPTEEEVRNLTDPELVQTHLDLYAERMRGYENLPLKQIQVEFTHIGGGAASDEPLPKDFKNYQDGCIVPSKINLKNKYGEVPKVLILVAGLPSSEHATAVRGLARTYKEQGVERVLVFANCFPHERQDKKAFKKTTGDDSQQVLTLNEALDNLALEGYIDAMVPLHLHSREALFLSLLRPTILPIIPIDASDYLVDQVRQVMVETTQKYKMICPDKGAREKMLIWAKKLGLEIIIGEKTRDREKDNGQATIKFPEEEIRKIQQEGMLAISIDDEIRAATTAERMADALGMPSSLIFAVVKLFCTLDAVKLLAHPNFRLIIGTNAVCSAKDLTPLIESGKLRILDLRPEIRKMTEYFRHHLVPDGENWLEPEETGSLLKLDRAES
jgi:phosphoribosylpyrophosphate synthetase